jgi:hypothetical protein
MTDKLCYITAYLDIGRDKWSHFQRPFTKYFNCFTPLVDTFKKHLNSTHELIVYIDESHHQQVKDYVGECKNVTVFPINEGFMTNNIPVWSRLDRERQIMDSSYYKNFVRHRSHCPETYEPRYTCINHAKIDFINFSKILTNAQYFCWVDFGYCSDPESVPKNFLDINKLDKNRINYVLLNPLTQQDSDVIYTIVTAPERVGGGFFFGNREKMAQYGDLYHKVHKWFQENNLADDDQHFIIQSSLRNPDLFKFHHLGGWFKALVNFQKTT